jgi:hypothetical protein
MKRDDIFFSFNIKENQITLKFRIRISSFFLIKEKQLSSFLKIKSNINYSTIKSFFSLSSVPVFFIFMNNITVIYPKLKT